MLLKVNGVEIAEYPREFSVTPLDLDNSESTIRTADGSLTRDRIAVKRQIEMAWGILPWDKISSILQSMKDEFFEFYYPDPMDGAYATKTFYVGNRPSTFTVEESEIVLWGGLKITLTEK